jgi:Bacterial archaeo-eukaryotic release factor family 7
MGKKLPQRQTIRHLQDESALFPIEELDLRLIVSERSGPHLSVFLKDRPGQVGRTSLHVPNEWSGWYDFDGNLISRLPKLFGLKVSMFERAEGSVAFLTDGYSQIFVFGGATTDRVLGGSEFYIKPILARLQRDHPFYLLRLSRNRASLFRGNSQGLTLFPLPDLPHGIDDPALAQEHTKSHTLHTVGRRGNGAAVAAFHGHADSGRDEKHDLERYFRKIETTVRECLKNESSPLVLAGVTEEMALYRKLNKYPHLMEVGFRGSPDRYSEAELHAAAWNLVSASASDPAKSAIQQYKQLHGTGRTLDAIEELVCKAIAGELGTLIISLDHDEWGTWKPDRREVVVHPNREPGDDELTNLAAIHVLRHGGMVYVVANNELDGHAAAGIRWLPMGKHGKGGPS